MKQIAPLMFAVALSAAPLAAQDTESLPEGEIGEGFSLMEEGAKLLFRGIMNEMEPALEDFADKAQEIEPALRLLAEKMGPALVDLMGKLDDVTYYEMPEILPNGDIIIRRSPDAPPYEAEPEPGEEIEL